MCRSATGTASDLSGELSGRQGVGVTQGARQPLMVLEEVQSQRRRKQEHGGSVAAVGPGACVSPHLPTGQGLNAAQPERLQLRNVLGGLPAVITRRREEA